MSDTRRTLKLSDETFQMLKADKPEGVTWDRYQRQMHAAYTESDE